MDPTGSDFVVQVTSVNVQRHLNYLYGCICVCVYVCLCVHIHAICTYATWVKVKDTTEIIEGTGKLPTTRNYPLQNVNSAEDEKSCLTTTEVLFSFSSRMNDG